MANTGDSPGGTPLRGQNETIDEAATQVPNNAWRTF